MRSDFKIINALFILIFLFSFTHVSAAVKTKAKIKKETQSGAQDNKIKTSALPKSEKKVSTYVVPQRMIIVSPYVSYIYANDIFSGAIEDKSAGFGAGLNARLQIYKDFGLLLDTIYYTNLEVIKENIYQEESDTIALFTGGFYYSLFYYSLVDLRIDMSYGAITAGNNVLTIFVPGIECFTKVFNRVLLFAKLGYPITNDWIVESNYEEHYTSLILSAGFSVIF